MDRANPPDAKQNRSKVGPLAHQSGNSVTRLKTASPKGSGNTLRTFSKVTVGHRECLEGLVHDGEGNVAGRPSVAENVGDLHICAGESLDQCFDIERCTSR